MIYWMTGLSGAGKSTIARGVQERHLIDVLDGDILRMGICRGLGFSPADRAENLRRAAHLAVHINKYSDVIVSCITPYESARKMVREICDDLRMIYVRASLEECRRRDPKGLYARSQRGEIIGLTGVDDPFEPPERPHLVIDTEQMSVDESIGCLLGYIQLG